MSLTAILLALALGCRGGSSTGPDVPESATLSVTPASVTLTPGDTIQMEATPVDGEGNSLSGYEVTWASGDTTVAAVDGDGTVTGQATGSTEITATAEKSGNSLSERADVAVEAAGGGSSSGSAGLITDLEPSAYGQDTLESGDSVYVDREYVFDAVPEGYGGWHYVRTANGDKQVEGDSAVVFTLTDTARVALAYDERATTPPDWLRDWTATGDTLRTTDVDYAIYARIFAPGGVALGGNLSGGAEGAESMYVLSAERTGTAPDDGSGGGGSDGGDGGDDGNPSSPPAAPSSLTASAVSSTRISGSFQDNSSDEDGFRVYRDAGSGFMEVMEVGPDRTAFSDTQLSPSTQYEYRVVAFNAAGESDPSNTASATTLQQGTEHPHEPAEYTAFAEHDFSVMPEGDNGQLGTWTSANLSHTTIASESNAPVSSSGVLQYTFPQGMEDGGSVGVVDGWDEAGLSGEQAFREIYQSVWIRLVPNEEGTFQNQAVGTKLWYVSSSSTANTNQNVIYAKGRCASTDSAEECKYDRFKVRMSYLPGGCPSANDWRPQNLDNSGEYPLTVGPWHHIEVVWRMNDIGSVNGELHVWVDGEKYIESFDIGYRSASCPVGFYRHHGDMIYGGNAGQVLSEDTRFQFDHLYISGVPQ